MAPTACRPFYLFRRLVFNKTTHHRKSMPVSLSKSTRMVSLSRSHEGPPFRSDYNDVGHRNTQPRESAVILAKGDISGVDFDRESLLSFAR